jgi:hypothetical protein
VQQKRNGQSVIAVGASATTSSTEADTTGQQEHDEDDEQDGDHGRGTTRDRIGPDAQVPRPKPGHPHIIYADRVALRRSVAWCYAAGPTNC